MFYSKYPSGKIPRSSRDFGKLFVCQRGCNTRTATYTDEFVWEDIYHGTKADIAKLITRIKNQTKATRKGKSDTRSEKSDVEVSFPTKAIE